MCAYQANIPQASQRIKDSQADLLANFAAIKTLIDVNHDTFGSTTEGKHKWVTMPTQGAAPATLLGETALYTKTSALTALPELFFRSQSSGTELGVTEAKLTAHMPGWAKLPCGLIMQWGGGNVVSTGTTLAYPITFPTDYIVTFISTANVAGAYAYTVTVSTTGVLVSSNIDCQVNFLALGF